MADDPNPTLRAELLRALDVVEPQVRGLQDFAKTSLSPSTIEAINVQIEARSRRAGLIQGVVIALDAVIDARAALERDGYPVLASAEVFATIFKEIQAQRDDLDTAAGVFEPEPIASEIHVDLGAPVAKTL